MICLPVTIILMTQFEEAIGRFHPIMLHFPIVLFTRRAFLRHLGAYFRKTGEYSAGGWLVNAGVLTCIPTLLTGIAASAGMDPDMSSLLSIVL